MKFFYTIIILVFCLNNLNAQVVKSEYDIKNNSIIYRVFDSLENYMSSLIDEERYWDKKIFISISTDYNERKKIIEFRFQIIGYDTIYTKTLDNIIKKGNRFLKINNELYPVYFQYLEYFLTCEGYNDKEICLINNYEFDFFNDFETSVIYCSFATRRFR